MHVCVCLGMGGGFLSCCKDYWYLSKKRPGWSRELKSVVYICSNAELAAGVCMMAGTIYRYTHTGKGPEQWPGATLCDKQLQDSCGYKD